MTKLQFRKLTAWLLSIVMLFAMLPGFAPDVSASEAADANEKNITLGAGHIKGAQKSNVYFGAYQQSSLGNTEPTKGEEGTDWIKSDTAVYSEQGAYYSKDPVKWRVLSNSGEKLFLFSDKILDRVEYHLENESVTWEISTMRSWLNGLDANEGNGDSAVDYSDDNFISSAFSKAEKAAIADTNLLNYNSIFHGTPGGNNTTDKVFLLSGSDACNIYYGFAAAEFESGVFWDSTYESDTRTAMFTDYVRGGGRIGYELGYWSDDSDYWWLRDPGDYTNYAVNVRDDGSVYFGGNPVFFKGLGVRPAFNLNISSVLFTSAAKGGKLPTDVSVEISKNTHFDSIADNDGYKLTLKDSSRNFSVADTQKKTVEKGETLSIGYTGTKTGTNEYISAMMVNESDEVIYYGQVAHPQTVSGKVRVKVPSEIEAGNYTLKIFNEQINGDYRTDYSSDFVNISVTVRSDANAENIIGENSSDNTAPFNDADMYDLFSDAVKLVCEKGLMNGTSENFLKKLKKILDIAHFLL